MLLYFGRHGCEGVAAPSSRLQDLLQACCSTDAGDGLVAAGWLAEKGEEEPRSKSPNTIRAYRCDIAAFRAFISKPIRLMSLGDLQRYADLLGGSPASCARRLLVVKSLLSFAARMGYTPFNIGTAIRAPRPDDRLAERILDENQVFALLDAVADHLRDHALIRLLYNGGLRVSEAVTLEWRNLVDGIANIRGKGGRTRVVRLSRGTWDEMQAVRPAAALVDDRVFPMTAWNAWDRVRRAARAAE